MNGNNNSKDIKGKQRQEEEIQMLHVENEPFEQTTCIVSKDKKNIKKRENEQ